MPGSFFRKLKTIAFFFIAAFVIVFATPYFLRKLHPPPPTLMPDVPPAVPISMGPVPVEHLDPCQNIYHLVCRRKIEGKDPTGQVAADVVGELEALKAYKKVIADHPDWDSDQIDEELAKEIYTPDRVGRIQTAYRWVEHALIRFINRQPPSVFNEMEKQILRTRLKNTLLQLPPPSSVYADERDLFTKNEVFYERLLNGELRMRVGGAYVLNAKSWFNLVFTLGHELAHSIDPCEIRSARHSFPAYDRLTACFLRTGLIAIRRTRVECGRDDQLSETFADWMAVHITAEALRNFSMEFRGTQLISAARNSVKDLCEEDNDGDGDVDIEFHPPPFVRIGKIFGQNPEIRQVLGCGPQIGAAPYCGFDTVLPDSGRPHSF